MGSGVAASCHDSHGPKGPRLPCHEAATSSLMLNGLAAALEAWMMSSHGPQGPRLALIHASRVLAEVYSVAAGWRFWVKYGRNMANFVPKSSIFDHISTQNWPPPRACYYCVPNVPLYT